MFLGNIYMNEYEFRTRLAKWLRWKRISSNLTVVEAAGCFNLNVLDYHAFETANKTIPSYVLYLAFSKWGVPDFLGWGSG